MRGPLSFSRWMMSSMFNTVSRKKKTPASKTHRPHTMIRGLIRNRRNRKKSWNSAPVDTEVRAYQRSVHLLIPRAPFTRLSKQYMNAFSNEPLRLSSDGACALQEATEAYLVELFMKSDILKEHAGRSTLNTRDLALACMLTSPSVATSVYCR